VHCSNYAVKKRHKEVRMQSWISTIVRKAQFDAPSPRARHLPSRPAWAAEEPKTSPPELAERRGEVLRGFFPKLASWFENSEEAARRREIEDYLSKAQDLFDLELRVRRLERQSDAPYPYY
jgi:hypothetical protein